MPTRKIQLVRSGPLITRVRARALLTWWRHWGFKLWSLCIWSNLEENLHGNKRTEKQLSKDQSIIKNEKKEVPAA